MGTHALGRWNCYSDFHEKKGLGQPPPTVLLTPTTHTLWRSTVDSLHYKQDPKALISPRAAENGAAAAAAAAASWTLPPLPFLRPVLSGRMNVFLEELIEKVVFNCRFVTLLAVGGSLGGSMLCFFQGCRIVMQSFWDYILANFHGKDTGHVILLLVEAIDVFLVATVMFIFGMGVYELFVSTIGMQRKEGVPLKPSKKNYTGSNLFGLFRLQERPLWLEIRSLHELKTKVGHVIVMILLVGIFEKSKTVPINTGFDLFCFSASILMSAGCLLLLSKLQVAQMNSQSGAQVV